MSPSSNHPPASVAEMSKAKRLWLSLIAILARKPLRSQRSRPQSINGGNCVAKRVLRQKQDLGIGGLEISKGPDAFEIQVCQFHQPASTCSLIFGTIQDLFEFCWELLTYLKFRLAKTSSLGTRWP